MTWVSWWEWIFDFWGPVARYRLEGGGCLPPSVHNKLLTLCLCLARLKAPSTSSNTELLMHFEGIKHSSHRFGMKRAYLKSWTAIIYANIPHLLILLAYFCWVCSREGNRSGCLLTPLAKLHLPFHTFQPRWKVEMIAQETKPVFTSHWNLGQF